MIPIDLFSHHFKNFMQKISCKIVNKMHDDLLEFRILNHNLLQYDKNFQKPTPCQHAIGLQYTIDMANSCTVRLLL